MSLAEQLDTWAAELDQADEQAYQKLSPIVMLERGQVTDLIRVLRDARDVLIAERTMLKQINAARHVEIDGHVVKSA